MSTPSSERTARRWQVADLVLTAGLLIVFVAALLTARDWSFKTGLFPQMVAVVGAALAALHLVVLVLRRPSPDLEPHGEDGEIEALDLEYIFEHASGGLWARTLGWVLGFFLLLYLVGIFVAAPVFTVAYLRFSAGASWLLTLVYAVVVGVLLYLAFVVFLQLPVPEGLLL
jgi:hypothetical protein